MAMCGCLPASLPLLLRAHCYSVTNEKGDKRKGCSQQQCSLLNPVWLTTGGPILSKHICNVTQHMPVHVPNLHLGNLTKINSAQ